ncbi:MAG TPA: hypothetical protein VKZ68_04215 [Ohtaekwangia sp.]|nr:hypothetical protein [Ohtaekwangia sp.]
MKKILLTLACAVGILTVNAQVESSDAVITDSASARESAASTDTAGDTTKITDEDLRKYAVVMDSVNSMKKALLTKMSDMVKNEEGMTNARYNDLSKAIKDEAKLKELKATEEEIAFINSVTEVKNKGAADISETFQTLAKDYIGVETYNEVKNALASDTNLKARYEAILDEVEGEESASSK